MMAGISSALVIKVIPFGYRHGNTDHIGFLECIGSEKSGRYLAGNAYQGCGINLASAMPVIRLVAPGPEVAMQTPTFRNPCISLGRMDSSLFMAGKNMP